VEGGKENPFIRLMKGQVLYEMSFFDEAKQEFKIAYELGGEKLFEGEESKYYNLIKCPNENPIPI
jgi:hypothetical protein